MLSRIRGFFMVINTLLVPVIVLGIGWFLSDQGAKFAAEWQKTKVPLMAIAQKAEQSAEKALIVAERTEAEIVKAVAKIEKVSDSLEKVGDSVAKPLNAVAKFKVPTYKVKMQPLMIDVPGPIKPFSAGKFRPVFEAGSLDIGDKIGAPFRPILTALSDIAGPLGDLKNAVRELEKLKALQPQIAAFQAHVGVVADQVLVLTAKIGQMGVWLAWALAALGIWLALCYIFWAMWRLQRGFALIAGRG